MLKKILGNVKKDYGECSKRFWRMFKKIPGKVQEDSGENLNLDLFCEILLIFYQILQLNCDKITTKLLPTIYNQSPTLKYCFSSYFIVSLFFLLSRKTLNNLQLRGLKNSLHRVGTINLKLENYMNAIVAYRHLT